MPGNFSTEAIVLGSNKLGDADRVVTLFTAERGRLPTVVKGVRKVKSRFGGRLEPFSLLMVQLYEGRTLHTLTGADTVTTHATSRDDPASLKAGLAVIDMVNRSIPEHEQRPRTYNLLRRYLDLSDELAVSTVVGNERTMLALATQLKLLLLAGYLPHLSDCSSCGSDTQLSRFSASVGGALCAECSGESFPVSPGSLGAMRRLLEKPLAEATGRELSDQECREIWQCIREVCRYHLGFDLRLQP